MKASELRIGNWVTVMGSLPHEVTGYHIYMMETYRPKDPNEANYEEMTSPILITQEWLEKFGFRYTEEDTWRDQWINDRLNLYGNPMKGGWTIENIDPHFEIHYVHQLQNLYFTLTGQELTIKEGA